MLVNTATKIALPYPMTYANIFLSFITIYFKIACNLLNPKNLTSSIDATVSVLVLRFLTHTVLSFELIHTTSKIASLLPVASQRPINFFISLPICNYTLSFLYLHSIQVVTDYFESAFDSLNFYTHNTTF